MLQFVNPLLLIGAAAFAVPLIIHLLNRQRFKRRPWAAMEFLLAAYKKQRRRLRRENLLLLLLRCLIPILLALAIARPMLRDDRITGTGTGTVHHVMVFDRSASMGLALPGGSSPLERARALAGTLLDRMDGREGPTRISLVLHGLTPQVPLRDSVDVRRAKARVAAIAEPIDGGPDLTAALGRAAEIVEASTDGEQRVYVFTDLQLRAFGEDLDAARAAPEAGAGPADPAAEPPADADPKGGETTDPEVDPDLFADTALDALRRIQEVAQLTVFDCRSRDGGGGQQANVQVTDLELARGHAIRNVAVPIVARLRNRGPSTLDAQVTLTVDDGQPLRRSTRLEPGAEGEVAFETTFQELGQRRLAVSTVEDDLAFDDHREHVVTVRDRIRVLVVENESTDDPDLRESTHVADILDPTDGEGPPDLTWFAPTVVDKITWLSGRVDPADFDMVVIANVSQPGNEAVVDRLVEAVRRGTGLFLMLGEGADLAAWERALHRGGRGPLPVTLPSVRRDQEPGGDVFVGSEVEARDHPVFRDFVEDVYVEILENVPVYRYIEVPRPAPEETEAPVPEESPDDPTATDGPTEVEVLLSARDAARTPLFVASRYGAGKVVFCGSPISRMPNRWNRFDTPVAGLSFVLLWPLAEWLTLPAVDPHNVPVGASLSAVLGERPSNLSIVPPERASAAKIPIGEEPRPLPGDRYALPPYRGTGYAGFYVYNLTVGEERGGAVEESELFAVQPDPDEGDLSYFSHGAARETLGVDRVVSDLPDTAEASLDAGVDELGPFLLALLVMFLVGEAAMARFVARRRA